jgi:hypothetical protein
MKLARRRSMYTMSTFSRRLPCAKRSWGHDWRIAPGTLEFCFPLPRARLTKPGAEEGADR